MADIELRSIKTEIRAIQNENKKIIEGYAAVFDIPAIITDWLGTYREYVRAGAFTKTLQENMNIKALHHHDAKSVLGSRSGKTLDLHTDSKGLFFRTTLPNTTYALDLWESVDRKDVDQCSFGFRTIKEHWFDDEFKDEKGEKAMMQARELLEVSLFEVTVTPFGAYEQTSASARSFLVDGLNYENLSAVLFRASKGLEINQDGKDILKRGMEVLAKFSEPDKRHSGETQKPNFSLLRAELDLLTL